METVFISKLKPFLDTVSELMEVYVPSKSEEHYTFTRYDKNSDKPIQLNSIRACTPVKEFLFPMRELAATYPESSPPQDIKPFAVLGLKECDLRSIEILDKVFEEDDFRDPLYINRREKMFIIASDCGEPGETCFCQVFGGKGFAESGFDLNISQIKDGFIIEAGSQKGHEFIKEHNKIFAEAPEALVAERNQNRIDIENKLKQANFQIDRNIGEIVENSEESDVFDVEASNCIECQACTRVCPTCHCFYLYDAKQKDYFVKMKMWDSCLRLGYASVAGGANPHKMLGDRLKHRFLHKFVYFLDRYGIDMCVGCGRCIDADAGGIDLREVLKKLNAEMK